MNSETIKTGKCPVCGSTDVYDNRGRSPNNHRKYIIVSMAKSFVVDTYVCIKCGYFKEFIRDEDMKKETLLAKVKNKWNKTSEITNAG